MGDLKNKFMDILFEDDQEDIISEDAEVETKVNSDNKFIAKDIMYRKPETSAFIDLDDTPKSAEEIFNEPAAYELSSQISPIFGVIEKKVKKSVNVTPEITESQTTKPADSHLDIITSPIYGYGSKEMAMDNNYDVKGIAAESSEDEELQLHNLFDSNEPTNIDVMSDDSLNEEEISLFRLFGENK